MGQLNFVGNFNVIMQGEKFLISNCTLTFTPYQIWDNISFKTFNFLLYNFDGSNASYSLSFGLYSLTGSTLSLANSVSGQFTATNTLGYYWQSLTDTSTTQNITPGTWFWGMLISTGGNTNVRLPGIASAIINPGNAFPNSFIGGAMTVSTNALPSSYAISDLDITGGKELAVPNIILSS